MLSRIAKLLLCKKRVLIIKQFSKIPFISVVLLFLLFCSFVQQSLFGNGAAVIGNESTLMNNIQHLQRNKAEAAADAHAPIANVSSHRSETAAIEGKQALRPNGTPPNKMFDISGAAYFTIKKGLEPNIFYFDIVGKYFSRFAEAVAGIQITSANTDLVAKVMYIPLNNPRHKIGLSTTYHLSSLYNIGFIHDFLASFEYTRIIPDSFIFFMQMGYMHQWGRVPVPHRRTIVIGQPSMTLALHFTGIIKREWFLGGGLSSYEIFRYPVFANPSISIDLYYRSQGLHLPKGFYLGLEGILRYSDLFTFSGYVANAVIKSVIGMEL